MTYLAALQLILPFVAGMFGLLIGSFLNVCIVRLPKEESVVSPRSHCPNCDHQITWYENIPVVSYVFLRGKCSGCGNPISALYPAIELTTGVMFAALAIFFGFTVELAKYAVFSALLLALTVTDLRERILPDELTLACLLFGVAFSLVSNVGDGLAAWLTHFTVAPWPTPMISALDSLLGAATGGGMLWLVRKGYFLWRGVEGMGFGDLKLMAGIGAFLGFKLVFITIFLGAFTGALIGGGFILMARGKDSAYELPFGSFLGAAAMIAALWGKEMAGWYMSLL